MHSTLTSQRHYDSRGASWRGTLLLAWIPFTQPWGFQAQLLVIPPLSSKRHQISYTNSYHSHERQALAFSTPVPTFGSAAPFDKDDWQILSYLPDQGFGLPPKARDLVMRATENYVFASNRHQITPEDVRRVLKAEYRSYDVPVKIDNTMFDVTATGEDKDESVAEILSLAALHGLPMVVALELLASQAQRLGKVTYTSCREALLARGWEAVSFLDGLALTLKPEFLQEQYISSREAESNILFSFFRRRQRRANRAKDAVQAARLTRAPRQRLQSRQELLVSIQEELSSGAKLPSHSKDRLLFFPNSTQRRVISLKQIKRQFDKQYARLKSKGQAGFLAYCFLNFLVYSTGVLLQWSRIAPVDPLGTSHSVWAVCLRKLARVFASVYVASQLLKLPKLIASVALAPAAKRCLNATKKQLRISETTAMILLVSLLLMTWSILVAIPMLADYASLRRLVQFDEHVMEIYGLQALRRYLGPLHQPSIHV